MTNDQLIDLVKRINIELYPRGEEPVYGRLTFKDDSYCGYITLGDVVLWSIDDLDPFETIEDVEKLVRARLFNLGSFWAKATTNKVSLDLSTSRGAVVTDADIQRICADHGEPVYSPEYCGGPALYSAQEVRYTYERLIDDGVLVFAKDIKQ